MKSHIIKNIEQHIGFLQCPVCKSSFELYNSQLRCGNLHSYDVSKTGYVNFLNKPVHYHYEKELFCSRNNIVANGFFDELQHALADAVEKQLLNNAAPVILDAGCGEGGIFSAVLKLLNSSMPCGTGVDIAKDAIAIASKNDCNNMWIVADIAQLPVAENSTDVVLNTLSPANYGEFRRILKSRGVIIKTIPAENYLCELRTLFGKPPYSASDTIEHFRMNCRLVNSTRITYSRRLNDCEKLNLVKMTPLMWHSNIAEDAIALIDEVTVDLNILTGMPN